MARPMSSRWSVTSVGVLVCLTGMLLGASKADAKSSSASSTTPAKTIACDYRSHPTITTVTPNHVKPGQKITISGKNFGTKECFHSVSFGAKSANEFLYLNPTTLEATVPKLQPGSAPVTVSTEAGTSEFKFEVQAK